MKNKLLVIVVIACLLNSAVSFAETIVNPRFAGKRCARADVTGQQLGVVLPVLQRAGIEYKVIRSSGGMSVIAR